MTDDAMNENLKKLITDILKMHTSSKLNELKALVRAWTKEKSLTTAYDICEFLANNLDLEDEK